MSRQEHNISTMNQPRRSSVSVNLMDLGRKYVKEGPPEPIRATQEQLSASNSRVSELLGEDSVYFKELQRLLEKAKGTPYEASMRKFICSKMGLQHESVDSEKSDTISLNTEAEAQLSKQKIRMSQQDKINELAQPLHRTEPEVMKVYYLNQFIS